MELLLPDKAISGLEEHVIFPNKELHPTLGVIIKTNASPDDLSYLKSIKKHAAAYEVQLQIIECANFTEASHAISMFKHWTDISGIIVLSSFGTAEIDRALANMTPSRLDLDCAASSTMGMLITAQSPVGYRFGPCAPVAVIKLLEYEGMSDLTGKKVAVLGRSLRVGRPLAEMLTQHNATVTCYHSKSGVTSFASSDYDIIVSAVGQANLLSASNFSTHYSGILIDVGVNVNDEGKLCGDFDFNSFTDLNVQITPVPGCIGKIATTVLFSKLFTNAAQMRGGFYVEP